MGQGPTLALALASVVAISICCVPTKAQKPAETAAAAAPAKLAPSSGERPAWVDVPAFVGESSEAEGGLRAYAVATCAIDTDTDVCWKPQLLIQACRNRALSELGKALGHPREEISSEGSSVTSTATLRRAEAKVGWYDGERTIYVAAEKVEPSRASLGQLPRIAFLGGVPMARLESDLRVGSRAFLEASGVCADPHRRPSAPCCGAPDTFCADATRHDGKVAGGKCRCGEGPPCLYDFKCEVRASAHKCICQGPKCRCEILNCRRGQTCGDSRCY